MRLTLLAYAKWSFVNQALPKDLEERRMVNKDGKPWFDYPYAADGLELWGVMRDYVQEYVALHYGSDGEVAKDEELIHWWGEVMGEGHGDLPASSWGSFANGIKTQEDLVTVLTTVMWIGSALHAAVNFAQYDYTSLPLNSPSLIRRPMPRTEDDKAWKDLVMEEDAILKGDRAAVDRKEALIMSWVNDPFSTLIVAAVVKVLSTHAEDEMYLSSPNPLITDPQALEANARFIAKLKELEERIDQMHREGNWVRGFPDGTEGSATYCTTLIPSSSPGATARGVPYSVSI